MYHREKKSDTLDKAKRNKLDVVMTTHDTARTHVVCLHNLKCIGYDYDMSYLG